MSIARNDNGKALYPSPAKNFVSEAALTAGGAATTLDVNDTLKKNGQRGYVANDGAGDFQIQLSTEGTNFNTAFTIKNGESFDLTGCDVDSIKITPNASNDSNYRILVW